MYVAAVNLCESALRTHRASSIVPAQEIKNKNGHIYVQKKLFVVFLMSDKSELILQGI